MRRIIKRHLNNPPAYDNRQYSDYRYLIFDGTFLYERTGIVALMNAQHHTIIAGQYGISENSFPQLRSFLEPLKNNGLSPLSCTVDGNPQAMRTLKTLWPSIITQRCLVHIQRQGLMWCRHDPKRYDAKMLRNIFLQISSLNTVEDRDAFIVQIQEWELRYGQQLESMPERGWVLSDLKRARSMLLNALPNMFHFLNDNRIPKTTNGLEGYFSRLKQHYRQHRGLAPSKRYNYFKWYFHLKPY